jgi:DNA polymerase III sliding clamp (beta) subunit (PCNA family)|uniref:Beta clamp protein n=1 Tax=Myoviridae sp. ctshb19 TaxID=2825194 RepID=A0A8S5UFZ2_9CAUD|nr:MAG TPA: beta clamp protein [Myoviridae sp. ctshb19]
MKLIEGNELEFTAIGKDIANVLSKIINVTTYIKADDAKFVLACQKNKGVYLIGSSTDALACAKVSDNCTKSGTVKIEAVKLIGLLKARGPCQFKTAGGQIAFKEVKGKFTAQLPVTEFDHDDIQMLEHQLVGNKTEPMPKEIVHALREAVKRVRLTDFYGSSELPIIFEIGEKLMRVYCHDEHHVALFKIKVKGAVPLKTSLPAKAFSVIEKFIESDKISFSVSSGRFRATGDNFTVSIPEGQLIYGEVGQAVQYNKMLDDLKPISAMTFDTKAVGVVSNMSVLSDGDTKMALALDKGKVRMSVQGNGGRVSDEFKANVSGKPLDIRVDPRIFMDLFNKISGVEIDMNFYKVAGAMSAYRLVTKIDGGALTLVGTYDEAK